MESRPKYPCKTAGIPLAKNMPKHASATNVPILCPNIQMSSFSIYLLLDLKWMAVSLWLTQPTDNILLQTLSRQSFGEMGVEQLPIGRGSEPGARNGRMVDLSQKKGRCESDSGQCV